MTPSEITKRNQKDISERQKLLSDMMQSITAGVSKRLKSVEHSPQLIEAICNVDHIKLWDLLEDLGKQWDNDSLIIDNKINHERKKYSPMKGIIDMFRGTYVVESWKQNSDPVDLQEDIVLMTSNLALVGALVLTMAIPMFVAVDDVAFNSSTIAYAYVFLLAVCGVLEGISVLLCIRNLLVINLVDSENLTEFITFSADVLMMPIRLNFIAILAMVGSLICYSLWQFGEEVTIFFSIVVILPSLILLLFYIGKGISDFNAVQGWDKRDMGSGSQKIKEAKYEVKVCPEH
eukprot:CAMPEP_0119039214 /NCGR_PEP_ID=MMETSP1177-20130426/8609_1 /TAXON_ID=2985 /ORGANISM="Ochromonas sp, Strain CCMP1899" /LENGTH=289 /DNA_ID=CAMNT_0007002849 /DNA_START=315 /DNA_END=1184 /DNA_ORIENTATION=-